MKNEKFLEERDWEQFHTPKNLSMAISVESSELMELFQWHDNVPIDRIKEDDELMSRIEEELADVIIYCISLSNRLDIDLLDAVERKMKDNEERFDLEKSAKIRKRSEDWQSE